MNRWQLIRFRLIQFAVLYLLISHPVTTWCQQSGAAPTGEILTLERAVTLALQNNRQVSNAALEVGKSEDGIAAFKTKRLPALKLDLTEAEPLTSIDLKFKQGDLGSAPSTGPIPPTNTTIRTPRKPLTAVNTPPLYAAIGKTGSGDLRVPRIGQGRDRTHEQVCDG